MDVPNGPFIISLHKYGEKDELLKVEGILLGKNILILSELEREPDKQDEALFFLRESIIPELRLKAKEKINELQGHNTFSPELRGI